MLARLLAPDARRAAAILIDLFAPVRLPFAFRLWDGTGVAVGDGEPDFTVSIRGPETLLRIVREPSPLTFAEAFVEGALDLEGDLFAAMKVANVVEALRLTPARRLRILAALLRRAA